MSKYLDDLREQLAEVYDRWCWETGSQEDWEEMKRLEALIRAWENGESGGSGGDVVIQAGNTFGGTGDNIIISCGSD